MDIVSVIIKFAQRSNVPLESRGASLARGRGKKKKKKKAADRQTPLSRRYFQMECSWQREEFGELT